MVIFFFFFFLTQPTPSVQQTPCSATLFHSFALNESLFYHFDQSPAYNATLRIHVHGGPAALQAGDLRWQTITGAEC